MDLLFTHHIIWSKAYFIQHCFLQFRGPVFDPCFRRCWMSFLFLPACFALLLYLFSSGVAVPQCPSTLTGPGSNHPSAHAYLFRGVLTSSCCPTSRCLLVPGSNPPSSHAYLFRGVLSSSSWFCSGIFGPLGLEPPSPQAIGPRLRQLCSDVKV